MIALAGGSELLATYSKDGAVIAAACTVTGITEHLIVLDPVDEVSVPVLGTMVELMVGPRLYRSTVQHTASGTFTVLRPRELEDLSPFVHDVLGNQTQG